MEKSLSTKKVRTNFTSVLRGVFENRDEVVIEHSGKPVAAIIPFSEFLKYQNSLLPDS